MRITDIEPVIIHVNHRGDWVFLQVHTDEGVVGLGEASHSLDDRLLIAAVNAMKPRIIDRSPYEIQSIWQQFVGMHGGRVTATALSAIEQALWDIMGQVLGMPIHQLFGGAVRRKIRLYANINRHVVDRSPAGFAAAALQAVSDGFTAVKLAPFDELRVSDHIRTGPHAAWRLGVERVEAVRAVIGTEVDLMVDCHGRMETSEAVIVADALASCNLMWYEEPVSHQFPDQLSYITRNIQIPTASVESIFSMENMRSFLLDRVVDVLMPDVKHCGGLREMIYIANAARLNRLLVAPHNPSGPVATVASAHVASVISNFLILEYAWGEVPWRHQLLVPAEPIENGYLDVSTAPGLGYRLNPAIISDYGLSEPRSIDSTRVKFKDE
ncbi:MAG: mandelate racemase/muconate lactonizing enzyme family protein [Anaerolineae bacterium]|nr:mandelate racemase/muconate lactonizing enzyme family protein [Anaerolineae bacterium]